MDVSLILQETRFINDLMFDEIEPELKIPTLL